MSLFVSIAYAADSVDSLIANINTYIINPFIAFLFVLATVLFLIGMIRYYIAGEEKDRETGKKHMAWGLVGMFIMISVFGIMRIIVNTFGIDLSEFDTTLPG